MCVGLEESRSLSYLLPSGELDFTTPTSTMCEGLEESRSLSYLLPSGELDFTTPTSTMCEGLEESWRNLRERYVMREIPKERFKGEQRVEQYEKFHIYEERRGENKQNKKEKRKNIFQEGKTWEKFPEEKKSCGKDESVTWRVRSLLKRIRT
jgi:hypothetical protein